MNDKRHHHPPVISSKGLDDARSYVDPQDSSDKGKSNKRGAYLHTYVSNKAPQKKHTLEWKEETYRCELRSTVLCRRHDGYLLHPRGSAGIGRIKQSYIFATQGLGVSHNELSWRRPNRVPIRWD